MEFTKFSKEEEDMSKDIQQIHHGTWHEPCYISYV
jgi:hypothetical protein